MNTCVIHDRLLGQRIPPLDADNVAPEAICRIPKKVPKMAAFDIVKVYQLTDEEHYIDYEPTYWDFGTPTGGPTQGDACAYEVDTSKNSFTWVSWVERTKEIQKQRIWICEQPNHLICNELDPEFKKPAIPAHVQVGSLPLPLLFTPLYTFAVSSDELQSFDTSDEVFISSIVISWTPPSWEEPSWEEPSWEAPSYECDWCDWEPEEPPYWWSMDFNWCEENAPDWYTEIPEWYSSRYVELYIKNNLTCRWSTWQENADGMGQCPNGCEWIEGLNGICECSSLSNPEACDLTDQEKSSLALEAFSEMMSLETGGVDNTDDWCYAEPPWLNIIPPNPDTIHYHNIPGIEDVVDKACDGITVRGSEECLIADNTGCSGKITIDPDCLVNNFCENVQVSFGIEKKCRKGELTTDGTNHYRVNTVQLGFDANVLQSTDCFNIEVKKRSDSNPYDGTGYDGIYFKLNTKELFEIDGSLSKFLKLEPEDPNNVCSKLLFTQAGGLKRGFILVKSGQLDILEFPTNDSILAFDPKGKGFYWEELKKCDARCEDQGGGEGAGTGGGQ